jgi:hypothetical protein
MMRDELVRHLVMLPPDADVVVDIGRIEVDILEIMGITFPGERGTIALKPYPGDLRDALVAEGSAVNRSRAGSVNRSRAAATDEDSGVPTP